MAKSKTKVDAAPMAYKAYHATFSELTEKEIAAEIRNELIRKDRSPRSEILMRLIGRFNRMRGERIKMQILRAATGASKTLDINAVLDTHG